MFFFFFFFFFFYMKKDQNKVICNMTKIELFDNMKYYKYNHIISTIG